MTPFEKAGYTKDTKFRLLVNYRDIVRGEIVTLEEDDDTQWPCFTTEDGRWDCLWLPGEALKVGEEEELEVYKGD